MKKLLLALLTITTTLLSAQTTAIWNGGTPGNETKWDEAKNWSGQNVPDEFSFVVIKQNNSGHDAQPVIDSQVEVASVEIHTGASLTISISGDLVIDGENTFSKGLSIYGGQLINEGNIQLKNIDGQTEKDGFASAKNNVTTDQKQKLPNNNFYSGLY